MAGKHYSVIPQAQRTSVPAGKVEVMEVFSYGCPACNQFQPTIKKLKASLPANAQLVYLPASWNKAENWPMFQRAYLTAQSLGMAEKAHDAMYEAIWTTGELGVADPKTGRLKTKLPSIEDTARFYQRITGVKAADFVTASKSFGVDLKIRQADEADHRHAGRGHADAGGEWQVPREQRATWATAKRSIELVKYLVAMETPAPNRRHPQEVLTEKGLKGTDLFFEGLIEARLASEIDLSP